MKFFKEMHLIAAAIFVAATGGDMRKIPAMLDSYIATVDLLNSKLYKHGIEQK